MAISSTPDLWLVFSAYILRVASNAEGSEQERRLVPGTAVLSNICRTNRRTELQESVL
jgi:hypothetical protein